MTLAARIRRHSSRDFASWVGAALLLVVVRAALRLLPYRVVERALRPRWRQPGSTPVEQPQVDRVLWAVNSAASRVLGSRPCLTLALVARRLLARHGYATDLRIGVAKGGSGALAAHAWLEHEGRVVVGGRWSPIRYRTVSPLGRAPDEAHVVDA